MTRFMRVDPETEASTTSCEGRGAWWEGGCPPEQGEQIPPHMEQKQEMPNVAFTHGAELNPNNRQHFAQGSNPYRRKFILRMSSFYLAGE